MTLGPLSVLWEKLRWQQPSGCLPVQCLFPQHRYGSSDGGLTPQGPAPLVRGRDNCEPGLYWDTAWPSISSNRSSGPGKQRQRCVSTCRLLCTRTGRNHFDWELAKDKFLALLLEAWWPWWGPPCAFPDQCGNVCGQPTAAEKFLSKLKPEQQTWHNGADELQPLFPFCFVFKKSHDRFSQRSRCWLTWT